MQESMEQQDRIAGDRFEGPFGADAGQSSRPSIRDAVAAVIRRALAHRRITLVVAILACSALRPALTGFWKMDDYFQRCTLLGYGDTRPIQVFEPYPDRQHNLAQMAFGTMPWWSSPDMHQVFFRYASTISM